MEVRLRPFGLPPSWTIIILLVASGISRLSICTTIPILPDEAYYYQWSQHLDASYFSKGPAIAWTIWAGTKLFGPNLLGVRIFSVLLSVGTAWQVFLLARRWFGDETAVWSLLLLSVVPIYSLGAILMTIDPLSAFFWIWAANLFTDGWLRHHSESWSLAGFAIGAGFLAKYLNGLELLAILAFCLTEKYPYGEPPHAPKQDWLAATVTGVTTLIWTLVGVWICTNPKAAHLFQPVSQFLCSFPANMVFIALIGVLGYFQIVPLFHWFSALFQRNHYWFDPFAVMLAVALFCSTPVWWWNENRGWPTVKHLIVRANMNQWDDFSLANIGKFLVGQALVVSPLLFLCLLAEALVALWYWRVLSPGARLTQALFLSVFLFYFILAFHYVGEANWPSISYLTLVILGGARISSSLRLKTVSARITVVVYFVAFVLGGAETVAFHSTRFLSLPAKDDLFSRTVGWSELAGEVQKWRVKEGNPEMMADAYKEASVVTFYLPDRHFVYTIPSSSPTSQYGLWPSISATKALYFTEDPTCSRVTTLFPHQQLLEHFQLYYRGIQLRSYYLFSIERLPTDPDEGK